MRSPTATVHLAEIRSVFLLALIILLLAAPSVAPSAGASDQVTSTNDCQSQLNQAVNVNSVSLYSSNAVSAAEESNAYSTYSNSFSLRFYQILNYWSWDDSCNVSLTRIDVVFSVSQGSSFFELLLISENPSTDQVLGVAIQQGNPDYVSYYNLQPWGGYQFYGNVYMTANVWESLATWSVPTPNEGYSGQCNNSTSYNGNANCQIAVWTGITHTSTGGTGIVQGGTASTLECKYSGSTYLCTRLYQLWTEFFSKPPVYCSLTGINSGDSIYAYALNQAVNPGGNSNLYNILVSDTTANKACSVSNFDFSQMGIPHFAEFMIETPGRCDEPPNSVEGNFGCGFPKFASFPMVGNLYYSGSMQGIYVPYQNGFYNPYYIQNCVLGGGCVTNSNIGSVSSSNTFSQIWVSSLDTY